MSAIQPSSLTTDDAEHWRNGLREFDAANELIALAIMCAFGKADSWFVR